MPGWYSLRGHEPTGDIRRYELVEPSVELVAILDGTEPLADDASGTD